MAHILVADGQIDQHSNHTGSNPYTFGQIGCGMEAQYIHLTPFSVIIQVKQGLAIGYLGELMLCMYLSVLTICIRTTLRV